MQVFEGNCSSELALHIDLVALLRERNASIPAETAHSSYMGWTGVAGRGYLIVEVSNAIR